MYAPFPPFKFYEQRETLEAIRLSPETWGKNKPIRVQIPRHPFRKMRAFQMPPQMHCLSQGVLVGGSCHQLLAFGGRHCSVEARSLISGWPPACRTQSCGLLDQLPSTHLFRAHILWFCLGTLQLLCTIRTFGGQDSEPCGERHTVHLDKEAEP